MESRRATGSSTRPWGTRALTGMLVELGGATVLVVGALLVSLIVKMVL